MSPKRTPTLPPSAKFPSALYPLLSAFLISLLSGCGLFRPSEDRTVPAAAPLVIALPANFSTGYRWVLDPPLQTAHLLDEKYSSPSIPGAQGEQTLRVVFPREGRFNLKLSYRRLWEPLTVPAVQMTNFVVLVTPKEKNSSMMEQLFPSQELPSAISQPEEEPAQNSPGKLQIRRP